MAVVNYFNRLRFHALKTVGDFANENVKLTKSYSFFRISFLDTN